MAYIVYYIRKWKRTVINLYRVSCTYGRMMLCVQTIRNVWIGCRNTFCRVFNVYNRPTRVCVFTTEIIFLNVVNTSQEFVVHRHWNAVQMKPIFRWPRVSFLKPIVLLILLFIRIFSVFSKFKVCDQLVGYQGERNPLIRNICFYRTIPIFIVIYSLKIIY